MYRNVQWYTADRTGGGRARKEGEGKGKNKVRPSVFALLHNPAYAGNHGIVGTSDGRRHGKTREIKEIRVVLAVWDDGDGLGRSVRGGAPWVLASPAELAGADAGLRLPGLFGLRRQAPV